MDEPLILLRPEGDGGRWIFRFSVPDVGEIARGEVTVNATVAGEDVPLGAQRESAIEKIRALADLFVKAPTSP